MNTNHNPTNIISGSCPYCGAMITIIGDASSPKELLGQYLIRKPLCRTCYSTLKDIKPQEVTGVLLEYGFLNSPG